MVPAQEAAFVGKKSGVSTFGEEVFSRLSDERGHETLGGRHSDALVDKGRRSGGPRTFAFGLIVENFGGRWNGKGRVDYVLIIWQRAEHFRNVLRLRVQQRRRGARSVGRNEAVEVVVKVVHNFNAWWGDGIVGGFQKRFRELDGCLRTRGRGQRRKRYATR